MILVKDKVSQLSEAISLDNSFYCEVVFKKLAQINSGKGWELQQGQNMKINLKD